MESDIAAPPSNIFPPAVILAGGEGRRLGGAVKALVRLGGERLIDRALARLRPQAAAVAVCVRAEASWTGQLNIPVLIDAAENVGPLAGVAAALAWARGLGHAHVLTAPADCPFLPADLTARLAAALAPGVDVVVATSGGRRHHLVALWPATAADELADALRKGPLAAHAFQDRGRAVAVDWPAAPVDPFLNINTLEDLARAEAVLSRT